MTPSRQIIILLLASVSSLVFGQTDAKKYEYEICVYYKSKEKPALLKNEIIGIADTTLAIVKGRVYDYNNKPLAFSPVAFDNKANGKITGCVTDSIGNYQLFIPTGVYSLTVLYVGSASFTMDEIKFTSGQIRQLDVKLGNANGFKTYNIVSDKPLNKTKLRRAVRQLKRNG